MKFCGACNTEKDVFEFGKRTASKDGLAHKCKSCQIEYDKKRALLPHRAAARAEYIKTDKGRDASTRAKLAWAERNAVKRLANIVVGNAVRSGKLIKPDVCEECQSKEDRIHGHHDDYAFPLSVRWLCPACHKEWHDVNGEGKNGR
jgi:transposase-like protein